MSNFDPEFDKLPDQPVTIGGDKSAAAWHGADADYAATLARIDRLTRERDEARAERDALQRGVVAATERAEAAEAERDALAHVIERGRTLRDEAGQHLSPWAKDALDRLLAAAGSAEAMALHDAEVRALAFEKEADAFDFRDEDVAWVHRWLTNRAAEIRAEGK